jgi:hypothetical protein
MAAELSRAGSSTLFSAQYDAKEEDGMGMRIATVRIFFSCATLQNHFSAPVFVQHASRSDGEVICFCVYRAIRMKLGLLPCIAMQT